MAGAKETTPLMGVTVQSSVNALMRERNSIAAGSHALDEVLAHASQISGSLRDQRTIFDGIGNKMMAVGTKFPVVNGLLNAIRRRKSRETIVITGLVVFCTLLLLAYLMRRRS
jgi:golgi SNAP receptor complex member 1